VTVERRALSAQVVQRLQERIATQLAVGDKLPPESQLMAELGVGRSTVREAVRVLAHMGLVEARQGQGTYVRATSPEGETLAERLRRARAPEVYELRQILEREIARLAALRRDEGDLERMREHLQTRRGHMAAGDAAGFLDAGVAFHVAVAAATKNRVLAELYEAFAAQVRTVAADAPPVRHMDEDHAALHEELAEAIARQDADAAQTITNRLLKGTAHEVRAMLEGDPSTHDPSQPPGAQG